MARPDPVLSMLSIAAKGRNLVSGEFSVDKAVKAGKAYLVLVAKDASDNSKKMFRNMCDFYEVPYLEYSDKETLGGMIGKGMRVSIAVTDAGIAASIQKKLPKNLESEVKEWQK